jgi:bacillithiol system protein YtxJ
MSKSAQQKTEFIPLTDAQALDELFTISYSKPVVLFKHSMTCPISSNAYEQMSQLGDSISLVVVQRARDISKEIETRTGVMHESPQAIILRNGQAVWNASHWRITSDAVEYALSRYE